MATTTTTVLHPGAIPVTPDSTKRKTHLDLSGIGMTVQPKAAYQLIGQNSPVVIKDRIKQIASFDFRMCRFILLSGIKTSGTARRYFAAHYLDHDQSQTMINRIRRFVEKHDQLTALIVRSDQPHGKPIPRVENEHFVHEYLRTRRLKSLVGVEINSRLSAWAVAADVNIFGSNIRLATMALLEPRETLTKTYRNPDHRPSDAGDYEITVGDISPDLTTVTAPTLQLVPPYIAMNNVSNN